MTELEKGPRGLRRGRGARERILGASQQLFRDQGINRTGLDQLCAVAQVSKRTFYQHFTGKDELIAEHLRRFDPDILPEVFDRTDLTPRERLLAAFDIHAPLCPFIAAAVEIHDPGHPARVHARDYKKAFAARLTETAREAGATNPEQLGEQLALLLDGASARNRVLNTDTFATAAAIAAVLIDNAIPRQRYRPAQAGTSQPGRGRVPDPAASSAELDAKGEVEVPARSPTPCGTPTTTVWDRSLKCRRVPSRRALSNSNSPSFSFLFFLSTFLSPSLSPFTLYSLSTFSCLSPPFTHFVSYCHLSLSETHCYLLIPTSSSVQQPFLPHSRAMSPHIALSHFLSRIWVPSPAL